MTTATGFLCRAFARAGRRFRRDARGNVAIIFAFASAGLLLATGAGMDLSRAYFARQKLSQTATLTCQYATRPSVVRDGATALYAADVNTFANNQLATQNWPSTDMPKGGSDGTSSTYFTATGAGAGSSTQEPTGVAELWYNMPTAFMKLFAVNQITVHAVMNCQPPSAPQLDKNNPVPQTGLLLVNEGFETGKTSYYFTNPSGQTGALTSPQNTFPTTAGYQGDSGNQFYLMGYCMEIDQVGVINSSTPQGTHSAELDCDNGSGSAGNSSISTKAYLTVGTYELRYNYKSRVDYPNYDPTYICGSTLSDVSWANDDSAGSMYGTRTNEINVYFDQSLNGAAPPTHTTLDGSQSLAGGNLIDVCLYGPKWLERSVKIKVTTTGYYWLSFAADGHNDSYGGQLDNIRLCVQQCSTTLQDDFPDTWTTGTLLFEDTFDNPAYSAPSAPYMAYTGNLANSAGATVSTCAASAPPGWTCQNATGWATAPYNQVDYYTKGAAQGSQYIAIDGNKNGTSETSTNRLISRPFLLDPGYYKVTYNYIANVDFAGLDSPAVIYCYPAPSSGAIYLSSYGNNPGTPRYATSKISTDYTTSIVGVFMSHGQLVSTPNIGNAPWALSSNKSYTAPALNAATSYTNPDGSVTTTPTAAPDADVFHQRRSRRRLRRRHRRCQTDRERQSLECANRLDRDDPDPRADARLDLHEQQRLHRLLYRRRPLPMTRSWPRRAMRNLTELRADRHGSSAVEFALVCAPLVFALLAILQVGIYFMTQAALDSGVNAEADTLNTTFLTQQTPSAPTAAALQTAIATKAGGLVSSSTLSVDLQPFSNLTLLPVAIGSNAPSIGSAGTCSSQTSCGGTILALRAQAPVISFAPFFGKALKVRSAVLVRRQAQ